MPVPTNDSRSVPGAATVPGTAYIARPGTGRGRDGSVRYLYLRMLMSPPFSELNGKKSSPSHALSVCRGLGGQNHGSGLSLVLSLSSFFGRVSSLSLSVIIPTYYCL
jgi:hypothetical protein